jgi:hypothetical protein
MRAETRKKGTFVPLALCPISPTDGARGRVPTFIFTIGGNTYTYIESKYEEKFRYLAY